MLMSSFADASKNFIPCANANAFPYSKVTFLSYFKSILFPIKYLITDEYACSDIL